MFRFSIRDLLWATVVVALVLGWWLHYRAVEGNRQAVIKHAERLHGELAAAKECCQDLESNVDYALKLSKMPVMPDVEMSWRGVDWTVLDEPIPGLISN
jgi:hypothetical protein